MIHGGTIRAALRRAVAEALERVLDVVHITERNPRIIPTPSIQIVTPSEFPAHEALDGSFSRRVTLELLLRDAGTDSQLYLDLLADDVEAVLGNPVSIELAGQEPLTAAAVYRGMTLALDSAQEDRVATVTLTFEVVI